MQAAISHWGQITSIRSGRGDKSISYTVASPELSDTEMTTFFSLKNLNCEFLITPKDETPKEIVNVQKRMDYKSSGEKRRSILYALWKVAEEHKLTDKTFNEFLDATNDKESEKYLLKIREIEC